MKILGIILIAVGVLSVCLCALMAFGASWTSDRLAGEWLWVGGGLSAVIFAVGIALVLKS
jgi:hypothetical protein